MFTTTVPRVDLSVEEVAEALRRGLDPAATGCRESRSTSTRVQRVLRDELGAR